MSTRCPTCGSLYADDAKFCTKDGGRLLPHGAATPVTPSPVGGGEPRATTPRMGGPTPGPGKAVINHANMAGQVLDGRYAIVKKVGEGGMSYVYLAHDVSSNQRYAIKILSPALSRDENSMARLRREASLGIRLAHPNVCNIVRLGETEDGLVYVVMPFVEGEILADRNHRMGVIPLAATVEFIVQICEGLNVAHELKIVHRDLKPENIMVCKRGDGTEYAVVMDFGLAKERKAGGELEKLTATGIILGTPEFMSPEQLRGKPLDPRTDIYSVALMMYEMLTGKLPFEGRTQQEMMIARLRNDPIPLRQRRPGMEFPEAIEKVLLKGMARNADDRHTTTLEFAADLKGAMAGGGGGGGVLGRMLGR
ncbi:MAG: serine/threonine protein kinase [Gemmatimonadetes bacterium]|nr:serine/threonine protein kinase [Gemmatimonadota bacterium]